MAQTVTIEIASAFPASVESIWSRLLNIDTLKYITRPLMTFSADDQNTESPVWSAGGKYKFKIRLFGLIPFGGRHAIEVEEIDAERYVIQTHENNKIVTTWNHCIELKPLANGDTQYTDIVEIYAGWLTPAVILWSKAFYRHRQKRWRRLLGG